MTVLLREVQRLRREVEVLREEAENAGGAAVRAALRRRGLIWDEREVSGQLFLPRSVRGRQRFYQLLKHYSFRLFLRDVIKYHEKFSLRDLLRYCSRKSAEGYLDVLVGEGLVTKFGRGTYGVDNVKITSFGPTLEWLVAQILTREFGMPSLCSLRLSRTKGGGDADAIAIAEGDMIYVETKSAPPRQISREEVSAFLDRLEVLRPQIAVFLEDTQLRMRDKIVGLFEEEFRRRQRAFPVRRIERETFLCGERIFIANSDPDLTVNIGVCLAQYFRSKGMTQFYS